MERSTHSRSSWRRLQTNDTQHPRQHLCGAHHNVFLGTVSERGHLSLHFSRKFIFQKGKLNSLHFVIVILECVTITEKLVIQSILVVHNRVSHRVGGDRGRVREIFLEEEVSEGWTNLRKVACACMHVPTGVCTHLCQCSSNLGEGKHLV